MPIVHSYVHAHFALADNQVLHFHVSIFIFRVSLLHFRIFYSLNTTAALYYRLLVVDVLFGFPCLLG